MRLAQLGLPLRDLDRARLVAADVRRELSAVADRLGRKQVADDWGQPNDTAVSNKLADAGRHRLHLEEAIDLILRDSSLGVLAALCEACGCEAPERKRVLEPAEKLARLDSALTETLGAELAEMLRRKAGLL
jgi:hypothetical protein